MFKNKSFESPSNGSLTNNSNNSASKQQNSGKSAFTPAELSRMYGIPYTAVKRLAAEGQIPSFKIGNRTYIMKSQFESFLNSHGMDVEGGAR